MSKLSVAHSLTSVSLLLPPKTWEGNQEILPNSKMNREILLNAKKYKLFMNVKTHTTLKRQILQTLVQSPSAPHHKFPSSTNHSCQYQCKTSSKQSVILLIFRKSTHTR